MLMKANGPVKFGYQRKCYTYKKTKKSNKKKKQNKTKRCKFLKSILLKKPNPVNISFA